MSKLHTLFCLLLFLFLVCYADTFLGNPMRETFLGIESTPGAALTYRPLARHNTLSGNMGYNSLGTALPPRFRKADEEGDDMPLTFGFGV